MSQDWTGRLLVATPALSDPNFERAVILLLQVDDEDGALGLVLNRPSDTGVSEVLPGWDALAQAPEVVFQGGPVQPQAAICLGRGRPGLAGVGASAVAAWSSLDGSPSGLLGTVDLDVEPDELSPVVDAVRVFAGYAGWAAGQLEAEVEEGSWWVLDALPGDAFSPTPAGLWRQVLRRQGPPLAFATTYPDDPTDN